MWLKKCIKWLAFNKLKVNENKTEYIIYGKEHLLEKIKYNSFIVGDIEIKPKRVVKNIGFMTDRNYTMQNHIDHIFKCCKYQLYRLGKIRSYLTYDSTKLLVNAFVLSRLDFQNSLLYGLPDKMLHKHQSILNSSIRLIFKLRKRTSLSEYVKKLKWLPIQQRIIYRLLIIIKKVILYKQPLYLFEMLNFKDTSAYMMLRNDKGKMTHVYSHNRMTDRTLPVAAQKLYDKLPVHIKNIESLPTYKRHLHKYLFESMS